MRSDPRSCIGALASVIVLVGLLVAVGSAGWRPDAPVAGIGTPADAARSAALAQVGLETVGPPQVRSRPAPATKQPVRPKVVVTAPSPTASYGQAKQRG